jgi:acyl carrier protein
MSREEIEAFVRKVISKYNAIPENKINGNVNFRNLGIDSLDAIDLALAIETEYSIEINNKKMFEIHTFNNLIDLIITKMEAK